MRSLPSLSLPSPPLLLPLIRIPFLLISLSSSPRVLLLSSPLPPAKREPDFSLTPGYKPKPSTGLDADMEKDLEDFDDIARPKRDAESEAAREERRRKRAELQAANPDAVLPPVRLLLLLISSSSPFPLLSDLFSFPSLPSSVTPSGGGRGPGRGCSRQRRQAARGAKEAPRGGGGAPEEGGGGEEGEEGGGAEEARGGGGPEARGGKETARGRTSAPRG